jgi:hypothetical protein
MNFIVFCDKLVSKRAMLLCSNEIIKSLQEKLEDITQPELLNSFAWMIYQWSSKGHPTEIVSLLKQQLQLAEQAISRALQLDEGHPALLDNLACCLLAQAKLEEGATKKEQLQKAKKTFSQAAERALKMNHISWEILREAFELAGEKGGAKNLQEQTYKRISNTVHE